MARFWSIIVGIMFMHQVFANNPTDPPIVPDSLSSFSSDQFIQLSKELIRNMDLDNAKSVIDIGLYLYPKSKDEQSWAILNYFLADYYYFKQDFRKARDIYLTIVPTFEERRDTLFLIRSLNSIGILYSFEKNNNQTLKYYTNTIDLITKIQTKTIEIQREKLFVYTNLINLYNTINNDAGVIENVPIAMELAITLNDSTRMGSLQNALGQIYRKQNNFNQSLEAYNRAKEIYNAMDDEFHHSFVLNNIGSLYEAFNRSDSALHYFSLSLKGFENDAYKQGIARSKLGIASIYARNKREQKAIGLYTEVIDLAEENHFNDIVLTALLELSELEYKLGKYKNAYDIYKKYNSLNDSLFSIEKEKEYAELQTKYEISLMENEISNLKNEKLSNEFNINRKIKQIQVAISFIIFLIIFIYVIYLFYRMKIRDNKKLKEYNDQIEKQNEKLTEMNNNFDQVNKKLQQSRHELIISNNSKNRFFSVLAHDLQSPFHNLMGSSYLLSEQYDKLDSEERKKMASNIHESSFSVNRLLENLLEWSRTQTNDIRFQPQKVDVKEIVKSSLSVLLKSAYHKSITIDNQIKDSVIISADPTMMETIFRNLVNNSIKFTNKGGKIVISARFEDHQLISTVEDNGVGIEKSDLRKIFRIDSKLKTKGTYNEKGTGLGLVICHEFIKYHDGKIWATSKPGIGSKFIFSIPV